jgi:hypothetical protein
LIIYLRDLIKISIFIISLRHIYQMLLVFRGLWNDGTNASMYREIMLRNNIIFQISTLVCLSSISICNLLIDLPTYLISPVTFNVCLLFLLYFLRLLTLSTPKLLLQHNWKTWPMTI